MAASRDDALRRLRQAGDELWGAWTMAGDRRKASWDLSFTKRGPAFSEREHLSARLETAHAHMVGRDVGRRALVDAYLGPRPRVAERGRAQELFERVLSDYCYHLQSLHFEVDGVETRARGLVNRGEQEAER